MKLLYIRSRLWQILEKENDKDKVSVYTDIFLISLIVLNIIAVLLETVDSIYSIFKMHFLIFERISTLIFLVEYILRVWVSIEAVNKNKNFNKKYLQVKKLKKILLSNEN